MKQSIVILFMSLLCGFCHAQGFIDHIVQRGETLAFLATKFGVSEQDIRDQNEDLDLDILYVGLPLQIPISENIDNAEQLITLQSSTNSVLSEANNYYESGKYRKAIKLYSKAIKENPNADLYYLRGRSYLSQGKYKSAIRDLESALTDNKLSMAFQSDCELLLADAQAKRETQLAERAEMLGALFSVAAATTVSVLSAKSASNASKSSLSQMDAASHSSSSSVNNAPLLSMSNSQFAAKNQQELNALMLKSRNDVNAQYWNEYQQFATYNKKPDGSNYSFDEWMALQGQAIQNLKNEGYDILAENQKRIDQQKADFEAERKADKEAWFEKMGYGKPSSTASTNSTSNTTSSTISAKDDKVKTSQTVKNSTNENLDSKQQYHTDAVSSDDYKYEKKVSLYIRDANTNRVMFSNKDLCKKDATYYVKLDNKYYRVESGNNWGFNSYIMYSSTRLMFNK